MCGSHRKGVKKGVSVMGIRGIWGLGLLGLLIGLGACTKSSEAKAPDDDQAPAAVKTAAVDRAERRLYDGAPPVIPHQPLGATCISCHNEEGMAVEGLGFSPPSPHELTAGMSSLSRCEQCHVFQQAAEAWVANDFVGVQQDLRRGTRLYDGAPPTMPHSRLMRENCQACHSGPAAREEIRTTHPERMRCNQCHLEQSPSAHTEPFPAVH